MRYLALVVASLLVAAPAAAKPNLLVAPLKRVKTDKADAETLTEMIRIQVGQSNRYTLVTPEDMAKEATTVEIDLLRVEEKRLKSKKATGDGDCEVINELWSAGLTSPLPGFPITGHSREGITFRTSELGVVKTGKTKVLAVLNGEVEKVGNDKEGYGHYIVIKHCLMLDPDEVDGHLKPSDHVGTLYTLYAHLHQNPNFSKGDSIDFGQVIGHAGVSGNATSKSGVETPQVHFETLVAEDLNDTWYQAKPRNPAKLNIDFAKAYKTGKRIKLLSRMISDYKRAADFLDKKGFYPQRSRNNMYADQFTDPLWRTAADAKPTKATKKKPPKIRKMLERVK